MPFDNQLKRLINKYPSLKNEIIQLINNLESDPFQGIPLIKNCFKIRLAIKSKGKGKSKGGRVVIHVQVSIQNVYLLSIYDKSEQIDIRDHEIKQLLAFIKN